MKQTFSFLILFFLTINFSYSQVATNLITITEGDAFNSAGLGSTFLGKVMNDGNLYFRGSPNGLKDGFWKTDGTVQGTTNLIEEDNTFGGNWDRVYLLDEGVLINDNNEWSLLSATNNEIELIPNLPEEEIFSIQKMRDGSYTFTTERDDNIILYQSDSAFDQVEEKGLFHPLQYSVLVTAGSEGAIVFNTNPFQDNFPSVYLNSTEELMTIDEYFASLSISFSSLSHGYIHDEFLIVSYKDADNFFRNSIINMENGMIADFTSIWEPISYHDYGDKFVIVTQVEVVSIDKNDLSYNKIFDQVFSFSTSELVDDKLYVIGRAESFSENLVEVDLTENTFRYLENARTGSSFYNPKMKYYQGELYYIAEDDHKVLMTYDFDNNTSVVVDTLSTVTGATVVHALETVNDELVISKRITPLQHELYVLGDGNPNSIFNLEISDIIVKPSVSNTTISVDTKLFSEGGLNDVLIFNTQGQLVTTNKMSSDGIIDISRLTQSTYFGIIKSENKAYRFKFIKI